MLQRSTPGCSPACAPTGAAEHLIELSLAGVRIRVITRPVVPGAHGRVIADTVEFLDRAGIPDDTRCFVPDGMTVACDLLIADSPANTRQASRPASLPLFLTSVTVDTLPDRERRTGRMRRK